MLDYSNNRAFRPSRAITRRARFLLPDTACRVQFQTPPTATAAPSLDLRERGVDIDSQFITTATGKRVKEYWLNG